MHSCRALVRRLYLTGFLRGHVVVNFPGGDSYEILRSREFVMATENQPPHKRMNVENGNGESNPKLSIGTHNGTFHCDEVLACYMLKQLPKYKDAEIIRSRDPAILDTCDIVVDVGAVFDPSKNRFDHHQRAFNQSMNSLNPKMKWTTKLSSAGLIYYHYGREALRQILLPRTIDEPTMDLIYNKMYENFVEEVDAVDNGIDQYDGECKYHVSTTIGSRVSRKNPSWNDKNYDEQKLFLETMEMVGSEFTGRVIGFINHWLPARTLVEEAVRQRFKVHKSGEIMELMQYCPWKDHLLTLEGEGFIEPVIKYVIYMDTSGKARLQCVPKGRNTFENRLSILPDWHGLRDEKLSEASGIPGCIFVHANGFIGGNQTREGALAMAIKSLQGCG